MLRIEGQRLSLRLVQPEDAAYLHGLRTDPRYNAHLSAVTGTIEDQRHWIETYKVRESEGREYYYVIERKDGLRCGAIRLYDIGTESFTWGSWILDVNKPDKAALESAVLSFGAGFDILGKSSALIDVRIANKRAISFYRRFGMTETGTDNLNIYFIYPRDRFLADRDTHLSVISSRST